MRMYVQHSSLKFYLLVSVHFYKLRMFNESELKKLGNIFPSEKYTYQDILTKEEIQFIREDTWTNPLKRLESIRDAFIVPKTKIQIGKTVILQRVIPMDKSFNLHSWLTDIGQ